jgi:serine/threonine protein kinase
VARFLDADPYADRPWLAMEYVPGTTLAAHVEAHGPLPAALVSSLGALLAEGLAVVHATGLLHRDIKPQNVIMGEYGPVLIDFGLGAFLDTATDTLSHSGMIIGTIRYMPPEQAGGQIQVTPAADVYGLGAVLLYAGTGHHHLTSHCSSRTRTSAPGANPVVASGVASPSVPLLTGCSVRRTWARYRHSGSRYPPHTARPLSLG